MSSVTTLSLIAGPKGKTVFVLHYVKSGDLLMLMFLCSGGKGSADEAERLLQKMHQLYASGDNEVKPNVVSYGAVIDAFAKCGETGSAARADTLLANMIELHQSDPVRHSDLMPNTCKRN